MGFTIEDKRAIPRDVKAVVRSPSILADRSLELVGNYSGGPQLKAGECIPLSRSFTQQSISRVIGSATDFVNAINPGGSTNIKDALKGIDQAVQGNGQRANELLIRSSALLDNPDQATAELGAITRNMAELTSMIRANRGPLKKIVQDMPDTTPDIVAAVDGAKDLTHPLPNSSFWPMISNSNLALKFNCCWIKSVKSSEFGARTTSGLLTCSTRCRVGSVGSTASHPGRPRADWPSTSTSTCSICSPGGHRCIASRRQTDLSLAET